MSIESIRSATLSSDISHVIYNTFFFFIKFSTATLANHKDLPTPELAKIIPISLRPIPPLKSRSTVFHPVVNFSPSVEANIFLYLSFTSSKILIPNETLGETKNLRHLIEKFFTYEDYLCIKNSKKELFFCVFNVTKGVSEYKRLSDYSYPDVCNWIWVSANMPIMMSLVKIGDHYYTDGGLADHIPLNFIINECQAKKIDQLDVIVHRTIDKKSKQKITGIIPNLLYTLDQFSIEVSKSDLLVIYKYLEKTPINIYYMPHDPSYPSYLFNRENMLKLWNLGESKYYIQKKYNA